MDTTADIEVDCRCVLMAAGEAERREIYRIRHEVYARELGQHPENARGELTDALDGHNVRRAFNPETLTAIHGQFAALDAERYPGAVALGRHIWNPAAQERFDYGLTLLLDGLERQVAATSDAGGRI